MTCQALATTGHSDEELTSDFGAIFRELRSYLLAVAARSGAKSCETEDVVQQAFMKLLESGRSFSRTHAKAYLTTSVRTILIDRGRRESFRRTDLVEDWSTVDARATDKNADAALHAKQLNALLEQLCQLESQGADVLAGFYRDGLSVGELGRRAGVTTGTITSKLARQRQRYLPQLRSAIEAVV